MQFTFCYQRELHANSKPPVSRITMSLRTDDQLRITEARLNGGPPIPERAGSCIMSFMIGKTLKAPGVAATGPASAEVDLVFSPD